MGKLVTEFTYIDLNFLIVRFHHCPRPKEVKIFNSSDMRSKTRFLIYVRKYSPLEKKFVIFHVCLKCKKNRFLDKWTLRLVCCNNVLMFFVTTGWKTLIFEKLETFVE